MTTRFENGIVVTLGNKNRVLWNATVVTDGERISAVGDAQAMKQRFPGADAVDCSGKIILPGFICTHHHFYSTMARGMSIPGEPAANFVEILERLWWKVDMALDEEDITLSAQLPLIDCIRNGTTTVIDHHASPGMRDGSLDLIESAVRQAGIRASLCYEVSDRNIMGGGVAENQRFIKKVGKGDGQIAAMMGMHASFTLSDATIEQCVDIARAAGVGCHTHVAEDAADREDSLNKYHLPTVQRLDKLGVTGEKSIFVHCVHIDEAEMDVLAATRTSVVHNPESNMNNAVGVTPLLKLLNKGVLVGLGTDGMGSDMLVQMRCAYLLHRLANHDPRVAFLEAPQLLLQNNSAIAERQFGLQLGEIAEGRPADLAILDYQPPTPLSEANFLGHLIFGLVDATVDTTVCKGKILMQGKQILSMDEQRLAARSRELAPKMWKRLQEVLKCQASPAISKLRKDELMERVALYLQDTHDLRDGLDYVKYAESKGFEAVWQAESRLVRDAIVPMAAYAAVTEHIKIGSGVINNWSRNIGLLASTFLTLDDLAPNRIICGIGAWWDPLAKNVGIDRKKPLTAMKETVTILRRLLNMERVTFDGEFIHVSGIELDVVHGRREPRHVPIMIGATGDQMMELAGEIADGVVLNYCAPPEHNDHTLELLEKGAQKSGRRLEDIDRPQLVVCSVDNDHDVAYDSTRGLLCQYLAQQPHIAKASGVSEEIVRQIQAILGWPATEEQINNAKHFVTDELIDRITASGTPQEARICVNEFRKHGCTCPILYPVCGDVKLLVDTFAP